MAEYLQKTEDITFEDYVALRDSGLVQRLQTYDVDWSKEWTIPACDEGG